ncbi:MAG: hypothetical protein AB7K52_02815 [Phycisphaerales bacterium]
MNDRATTLSVRPKSAQSTSTPAPADLDPRWTAIRDYPFDEGHPALTFIARLARENGWSRSFAERVLHEYRRFLYLALAAGHPVTPSDHVDQAWHLHLTYSRSYWDRLCRHTLGQPLHHEPTQGGQAESTKFDDWYSRTLDSYRAAFAAEPPCDVWPPNDQRFNHDAHCRRVNLADNWVIPKRRARSLALSSAAASLLLVGLAGCGTMLAASFSWGPILLVLGGIAVAILVLAIGIGASRRQQSSRRTSAADTPSSPGSGCSGGLFPWWFMGGGSSSSHSPSDPQGADSSGSSGSDAGSGGTGCSGGSGCGGGCGGGGGGD